MMDQLRRLFDFLLEPKDTDKNLGLFRLFVFAIILVAADAVLFLGIQIYYLFSDSDTYARLGQVGDFFGGTLNPPLTFLTFIGVLATIFLQRKELAETREELTRQADALVAQQDATKRQTFESTFFQMLTLHNDIVSKIQYVASSMDTTRAAGQETKKEYVNGREAFGYITTALERKIGKAIEAADEVEEKRYEAFLSVYSNFWHGHSQTLSHYFRFLFNLVRFVDESDFRLERKYMRLVRAQLSDEELYLLFYNCLTPQGLKFKSFAEDYSLFDNVPPEKRFDPILRSRIDDCAFRSVEANPTA